MTEAVGGVPVTPSSPIEALEPWIAARLHPLSTDARPERRVHADYDLEGEALPGALSVLTPAAVLAGLVPFL